jgi:hypothetical protein
MLQLNPDGFEDFIKNRMEVVEGGRLKLDMEDWSFGNGSGLVKDWSLPEFVEV